MAQVTEQYQRGLEQAGRLKAKKISEKTRKKHRGNLKRFADWIEENGQSSWRQGQRNWNDYDPDLHVICDYLQDEDNFEHIEAYFGIRSVQVQEKTLDADRSSFHHVFSECSDKAMPEALEQALKDTVSGHKKQIAFDLKNGHRESNAKVFLGFSQYREVCKNLIERDHDMFAHLALVLTWNGINRIGETMDLNLSNISGVDDCLSIIDPQSKCNQEGEKEYDMRIYSNPLCPEIDPFLSMAIYLAAGLSDQTTGALFPGENQENRVAARLKPLGDQFGTHSIRKGAGTYAATGTTASPAITAIMNRAQWTTGGVLERYLKMEKAGDSHLGRTLCGLDACSRDFACLPAHFVDADAPLLDETVIKIFPTSVLDKLGPVLTKYLLASLLHHYDYLRGIGHPVLTSLAEDLSKLQRDPDVVLGPLYDSPVLQASGVPPHTKIICELSALVEQMKEVTNSSIQTACGRALAEHAHASGSISAQTLESCFQKLTTELMEKMPGTNQNDSSESPDEVIVEQESDEIVVVNGEDKTRVWVYGGAFNYLPPCYEIDTSSAVLWKVLFMWNKQHVVNDVTCPPLKTVKIPAWCKTTTHLDGTTTTVPDLKRRRKFQSMMSKFRCINRYIIERKKQQGVSINLSTMTQAELQQLCVGVSVTTSSGEEVYLKGSTTVHNLSKAISKAAKNS